MKHQCDVARCLWQHALRFVASIYKREVDVDFIFIFFFLANGSSGRTQRGVPCLWSSSMRLFKTWSRGRSLVTYLSKKIRLSVLYCPSWNATDQMRTAVTKATRGRGWVHWWLSLSQYHTLESFISWKWWSRFKKRVINHDYIFLLFFFLSFWIVRI